MYLSADQVPAMGTMAGRIWNLLAKEDCMSVSAIVRRLAVPRDYVMEGLGWLGREGKIEIHDDCRIRLVSLKTS